jgi:hypothetical protein
MILEKCERKFPLRIFSLKQLYRHLFSSLVASLATREATREEAALSSSVFFSGAFDKFPHLVHSLDHRIQKFRLTAI